MTYADEMEPHVCPTCGIKYAAPKYFFSARRAGDQKVKNWWCPNGHSLSFTESENDALRRERDRLKQDAARLEEERAAETAARKKAEAQLKQTMLRAGAGVCPCCNRTFQSLARHMKTKHPDIAPLQAKSGRKR